MPELSFGIRRAGDVLIIDYSMKGGSGCRPVNDAEREMIERIAELEDGIRQIRDAAIKVGDGETWEALENCAEIAMEITSRLIESSERLDFEVEGKALWKTRPSVSISNGKMATLVGCKSRKTALWASRMTTT